MEFSQSTLAVGSHKARATKEGAALAKRNAKVNNNSEFCTCFKCVLCYFSHTTDFYVNLV
jgi:hypothetical protein